MSNLRWTFEELGYAENKSLEVEFECYSTPGRPGTYMEPPEPAEVDFRNVKIISFLNQDGEIAVSLSWQSLLKDIAFDLADRDRSQLEERLWEQIGDAEEDAREAYYDWKRDEMRGC